MILGTTTAGSGTCLDKNSAECQAKSYLCTNAAYKQLMTEKCPATCGFCGQSGESGNAGVTTGAPSGGETGTSASGSSSCTDVSSAECQQKKNLCTNTLYRSLMEEKCPATCGFCNSDGGAAAKTTTAAAAVTTTASSGDGHVV